MRTTARLLAAVKPDAGKYLQPGNPTGLTGLFTHPSPRSTLLYIYSRTLDKLKELPEYSVYRQSAEALTTHRMNIILAVKPAGWDEWAARAKEKLKENPDLFKPGRSAHVYGAAGGLNFVETQESDEDPNGDGLDKEWNGEIGGPTLEGTKSLDELPAFAANAARVQPVKENLVGWEAEPALEASQIVEAENKIGAGLIEEVIQVAEGELKLVDTMLDSQVWDELEEAPPEGQWSYFARDQHTSGTQETPSVSGPSK